jgi:hypothetical protein
MSYKLVDFLVLITVKYHHSHLVNNSTIYHDMHCWTPALEHILLNPRALLNQNTNSTHAVS